MLTTVSRRMSSVTAAGGRRRLALLVASRRDGEQLGRCCDCCGGQWLLSYRLRTGAPTLSPSPVVCSVSHPRATAKAALHQTYQVTILSKSSAGV